MSANFEQRKRNPPASSGPYIAEITSHLDPIYMGRLEVSLIKNLPNRIKEQSETYIANYCSPFMGSTDIRFEGNNSSDFNDVQKSYGFWMVPPDVGTRVLVLFIDGDPNQCYWFGCIQDPFQNHMIPGIAASREAALTAEQRRKYGVDYVPVAEVHKTSIKEGATPMGKPKPVHPFADRLMNQGLLKDTVRGVTNSSARREVPSHVFGISTPGPIDASPSGKRGKIGYGDGTPAPVSRLGGSSFVMDDGDISGQNELMRLRTRTGHQLLLHNSQDLIYIGNSRGTTWIEFTSNGKIDIFSQDSISIHSEQDFNFRADRDINFEAGRNIHIRSGKNMETNIGGYYYLTVDDKSKISVGGTQDYSVAETAKFTVGSDYELLLGKNFVVSANGGLDLSGETHIKLGSAGNLSMGTNAKIIVTGNRVDINGPIAPAPATASQAEVPPDLPLFTLPNRKKKEGWENFRFYRSDDPIKSIMQRVPTHEPYDQHENINPQQFTPEATDITLADRSKNGVAPNSATKEGGASEPQQSANQTEVTPGTCKPEFAKDINNSSAQAGIAAIKAACSKLGLTSPYAVAALLGIAGGECQWKLVEESFKYSAPRLLQVFPSVFKGDQSLAQQYAANPSQLPEFLYGSNTAKGKGLGNTQSGDGAKFIGRGYIQLTGRSNYTRYSQLLYDKRLASTPTSLVDNPALLNTPEIAAQVSALYMLDRCKVSQTDPGYFEAACKAVGFNTPDIKSRKKGYYECFLAQLQGTNLSSGTGGIVTDSSGNPIRTGSAGP